MSDFAVTIDADCLYPAAVRDTLLRLAQKGLFRPHWSDEIVSEAIRNLLLKEVMSEEQARYFSSALHEAFPEAFVTGYRRLQAALTCHEDDRHVLAVAIRSQSQILITNNLADFPPESVDPFEIEVQSPDEFLCNQLELDRPMVSGVIVEQAAALRNPPHTIHEVLAALAKTVPAFANAVLTELGLIETPSIVKQAQQIAVRHAARPERH